MYSKLYNYPSNPDNRVLQLNNLNQDEEDNDDLPILKDEDINAIKNIKDGKLPGSDIILSELLKHGGESIAHICIH